MSKSSQGVGGTTIGPNIGVAQASLSVIDRSCSLASSVNSSDLKVLRLTVVSVRLKTPEYSRIELRMGAATATLFLIDHLLTL